MNRLPRDVVQAPFLEIFKVRLDEALSNLISLLVVVVCLDDRITEQSGLRGTS